MKFLVLTLAVFLISITSFTRCFAKDAPFQYEWINCDYNGVTHNDKVIVCYGEHGIVTSSSDKGKTWN
jgi:hypothetical protein